MLSAEFLCSRKVCKKLFCVSVSEQKNSAFEDEVLIYTFKI